MPQSASISSPPPPSTPVSTKSTPAADAESVDPRAPAGADAGSTPGAEDTPTPFADLLEVATLADDPESKLEPDLLQTSQTDLDRIEADGNNLPVLPAASIIQPTIWRPASAIGQVAKEVDPDLIESALANQGTRPPTAKNAVPAAENYTRPLFPGAAVDTPAAPVPRGVLERELPAALDKLSSDDSRLSAPATQPPATQGGRTAHTTPTIAVPTAVGSSRWADDLASRVSVVVRDGVQHARVELSPPALGPLDVRLRIHDDHAEISFTVNNAVTRDAMETAGPRLREMMMQNGFANVNVNIDLAGGQDQAGSFARSGTAQSPLTSETDPGMDSELPQPAPIRLRTGMVDEYI